jgi:glycine cleavage system H protein
MKFAKTHEWITTDNGIGTVGISKEALDELGEIVFVELPKVGAQVKRQEEVCVIESTKAAVDLYSPVTGEIIAINNLKEEAISKLNQSPEGEGWLYKIKLSNLEELQTLLDKRPCFHDES